MRTRLLSIAIIVVVAAVGLVAQSSPCPGAIGTNILAKFRGGLAFVCLQAATPPRLDVIRYSNRELIASIQVDERGRADKISSFVDDDGNLRIILAIPDRLNGTSIYSIDKNGHPMPEVHTVSTQFVDQMSTWKLELNLDWQLAIANQPAYDPSILHGRPISDQRMPPLPDPKPIITIYSWRSTYFDRYQLIYLPQDGRVTKLEPMNINGQEFLLVAMDSNRLADKDATESGLDSLVYKLDFGSGDLDWREFQRLPTRFAHDAKPFYLTHRASLLRGYYIAIFGQMKVTKDLHTSTGRFNVTDEEDGLIIYKYLGDQFVQTHAYPAQDMTKLEALTYGEGDTYVIMALLSQKTRQVSLLWFDGLTFQKLPSPSMIPTRRPAARQRRTMTNLQLFLAPPSPPVETANGTVSKRTLDSDDRQPAPMLSFSDPELYPEGESGAAASPKGGAYEIPTSAIVEDGTAADEGDPSSSHSKRDQIPHSSRGDDLLGWCKTTINKVLLDNFDVLSKQLLVLPRVDQHKPIELDGDLLIEDDLHVSNLLYVRRVEENRGGFNQQQQQHVLVESNPSNFSQTFNEIQRVHREIDDVKNRVDQILVDDGTEQNVFNQFVFDTLVVECQQPGGGGFDPRMLPPHLSYNNRVSACPHINDIRTSYLNNHNVSNIHRQALLTGRTMIIERDVRFEHLILQGSVNISRTLNGIPPSEIVFKKGFVGGPISGHKDFRSGLYSQSGLDVGSWRGDHLDRGAFFTSSGDQTIPYMRFAHVVIDSSFNNISHIKQLNGLDLGQHLGQIALSGADNQFEAPVQFEELILNGPIHMVGGLSRLSSIDLEELWLHTMFKQSRQNVSVPMDFVGPVHVSYGGNMVVNGPVNGLWLHPQQVLMRNTNYSLPNPIIFDGSIDVSELQVWRALNGIQVLSNRETRRAELALLYNEGTQHISGDKVLGSLYLGGRSTIMGNINGHLNLTQLHDLANSYDRPHHFQRIRLTGQDVRIADRANIHISSTINGVSTADLCSLALSTYNKSSATYKSLRFKQPINFRSLRCGSINGFTDLESTFLTKYGNQYVSGDLRLRNGAIFNTTLTIQSTLNGLPVGSLPRAITKSINETRTGHKDFYGDLVLEDLIADRINDLRLGNIFLAKADSPQIVRAPMTFDHLDIENVLNIGNLITNTFNNLNVTDVMTNTLTYDTPQVIHNHIQLDTLQLLGGSNLQTQSVNGRNLRRVFSDAVLYDVPQQILAPKTFRGPVEFAERMHLRFRIDGLSFEDIRANLLLLSDDLIDGDLVLDNDCTIRQILEIQSKTINDIDLDAFVGNMIHEGQPLRVAANGSIRFHDVAAKDVVVGGTVQGVDLSREAMWQPRLPIKLQPGAKQQSKSPQLLIPQLIPLALPLLAQPPQQKPTQSFLVPHRQQQLQQLQLPFSPAGTIPNYQNDYNLMLRAHALADLSSRVNRHLSLNFYYEIVQKHPLLGPLMYYARDSLFLKATGKPGEPCLHRNQTIAIMSKGQQKPPFTQTSIIQETSNPRSISSVANHLFVLDEDTSAQVFVYSWDQAKSLYELQEKLALDGPALAMKAFTSDDRSCLIVASSSATIYCQAKVGSRFTEKSALSLASVVDLDVHPIQGGGTNSSKVLIASISHQNTRQIGDLTVAIFDSQTKQLQVVASKKMIRPLKLHFFRNGLWSPEIQLAVSEAITNNDNVQSTSRIFSMRTAPTGPQQIGAGDGGHFHFHEVQEIRDNQFYDIQSVLLDGARSLLLFQSAHSISVYAPSTGAHHSAACDAQWLLLQRIPTKGANKFLVFNDNDNNNQLLAQRSLNGTTATTSATGQLFNHYLVLSKDECDERQQYATLVLKAQFK